MITGPFRTRGLARENHTAGGQRKTVYKTWDQQKVEHQATYERLIVLERYDLLETYRPEEYHKNRK